MARKKVGQPYASGVILIPKPRHSILNESIGPVSIAHLAKDHLAYFLLASLGV